MDLDFSLYKHSVEIPPNISHYAQTLLAGMNVNRACDFLFDNEDWRLLKGTVDKPNRYLDLGCGSSAKSEPIQYSPIFCEIIGDHIKGTASEIIGIDILPQPKYDSSRYSHIQADLVNLVMNQALRTLPQLAGNTFNWVNCNYFVSSHIDDVSQEYVEEGDPILRSILQKRGINFNLFRDKLLEEANVITAENGFIYIWTTAKNYYKKVDGQLQLVYSEVI
jgi:hypothetical protein